jgi:Na+/H+ antiporter NhaA
MKNVLLRSAAAVGGSLVPALAFAQTAPTEPTVTAAGLLTSSGADVTQIASVLAIVAAPILLIAVGFTVIMNLRRGAKMAR